uniref:Putative iron-sulfur cluster-binding domain contining protein n=1 Tax=viral metagenome TaxID=1070528 RepID=A0A6M3K9X9_9ZZZZ
MDLGYMSYDTFHTHAGELLDRPDCNTTILPFWRGEALLHHDITAMMALFFMGNWKPVVFATNGHLITALWDRGIYSFIKLINISVHDQQGLQAVRWLLDKRGLAPLPMIQASFVEQSQAWTDLAHEASLIPNIEHRIYAQHTLSGVPGQVGQHIAIPSRMGICSRLLTDIVIGWDGHISRCCYVWNNDGPKALSDKPISELWNSQYLKQIRDSYPDNICLNCDQWSGNGRTL